MHFLQATLHPFSSVAWSWSVWLSPQLLLSWLKLGLLRLQLWLWGWTENVPPINFTSWLPSCLQGAAEWEELPLLILVWLYSWLGIGHSQRCSEQWFMLLCGRGTPWGDGTANVAVFPPRPMPTACLLHAECTDSAVGWTVVPES